MKPTMAHIWEKLTRDEKDMLCRLLEIPMGRLALMKIDTIMDRLFYPKWLREAVDKAKSQLDEPPP